MSPTPEEARQALRDVDHRRDQSAAAGSWPRWTWITGGVVVAAYGVLVDQQTQFLRDWGSTIVVLMLLAVVLSNSRWGSSLLRRPVRTRPPRDLQSLLWPALVLILVIGATLAVARDVPHAALWSGLAGGVLLAVAGPWWQRRLLTRETSR
jgi:hypothetical protein